MLEPPDGRLAGVVAHQLGTGVAVIDACASRLRAAADAPDVVEALQAVGERLRRVDEDLHDLARIARRRPTPALVRAAEALAAAREEFAADETHAAVTVNAGKLARVYADRAHLERLFVHLLDAVANAGATAISIDVRRDADVALFLVADERALVERRDIASMLGESRPGHRPRVAGTSVGLEVCRAIVESHGGRVRVHHDANGRLAVAFSLPASPPAAGAT